MTDMTNVTRTRDPISISDRYFRDQRELVEKYSKLLVLPLETRFEPPNIAWARSNITDMIHAKLDIDSATSTLLGHLFVNIYIYNMSYEKDVMRLVESLRQELYQIMDENE